MVKKKSKLQRLPGCLFGDAINCLTMFNRQSMGRSTREGRRPQPVASSLPSTQEVAMGFPTEHEVDVTSQGGRRLRRRKRDALLGGNTTYRLPALVASCGLPLCRAGRVVQSSKRTGWKWETDVQTSTNLEKPRAAIYLWQTSDVNLSNLLHMCSYAGLLRLQ